MNFLVMTNDDVSYLHGGPIERKQTKFACFFLIIIIFTFTFLYELVFPATCEFERKFHISFFSKTCDLIGLILALFHAICIHTGSDYGPTIFNYQEKNY